MHYERNHEDCATVQPTVKWEEKENFFCICRFPLILVSISFHSYYLPNSPAIPCKVCVLGIHVLEDDFGGEFVIKQHFPDIEIC